MMGWMVVRGQAFGRTEDPELIVMRRDEEALGVAASVVIRVGKQLLEAAEEEMKREGKSESKENEAE